MMSDHPTILLIDDASADRMIYGRFLLRDSQSQYIILEAASGQEGLNLCQQVLPDLILLDYRLPDMDGLEFLSALEQQFGQSAVPVITLTGQGDERIAVQMIKGGAQDYLVKAKLTSESLCAAVRTAIQQFRLQQQLQWQQQQQHLINAIALQIHQSLNLQTILDTSVDEIRQSLKADRVVVYQLAPDTTVRVVAESVLPNFPSCLGIQFDQPCDQEPLFANLVNGQSVAIPDIDQANLTDACLSLLKPFQVKALLAVPILLKTEELHPSDDAITIAPFPQLQPQPNAVETQLWGLLLVQQCHGARQWHTTESNLLKPLAVQMAIAIQQAELHHSLQTLNAALEQQVQERTAALQISQDKLSDILDSAIACIISYRLYDTVTASWQAQAFPTRGWEYEYCSAGSEKVFGFTPQEFTSDKLLWHRQIFPEDWHNVIVPRFAAVLAQETTTVEYRFRHKNGSLQWISESLTSRWDHATNSWIVTVVSTNISDRKQIETERNIVEAARKLRETQLWHQQVAMTQLSQSAAIYSGNLDVAMQHITQTAAQTLNVERLSVWFYSSDRQTLDCTSLYQLSTQSHTAGTQLNVSDYPAYFQALDTDKLIAAHDAHHDPRTQEFSDAYLTPLGITSMLDIPIRSGGETVGVLCLEQVGSIREWLLEEQNFGTYLAHLVSLALEARDRKHAEAESQQNQRFLDSIIEHLPNMVFVKDAQDLRFVRFNRAGEELLGYSRDDLIGKNDYDFFPQEEADFFTSIDRTVLKSGELLDIPEEPIQTRWNGIRFLHTKKIPLVDKNGKPQYLMGISEDITEYKQAQEALRQSEERWQLAIQGNNDGIWDWNIVTGETFRSPRWYEILGYTPDELSSSNDEWSRRIHPQDVEKVIAFNQAYLKRQFPIYDIEYRIRCKDGSYKWLQSRGQAQWNEAGEPIRMVGSFRDISDLKLAEDALRRSERRYATLTEISPVGIFRTDIEGDCLYVNPSWCQMAGLSPDAASGRGWVSAIYPDDRDRITSGWDQATLSKSPFAAEFRFQRPDGSITWVVSQAVAEQDINGNVVGYVGTVTDISDRKQFEIALQEAKETAEVANRAKGEFISRMSHELRTPLNAILGFTQVMQGDPNLSTDYQDYLNSIYDGGEHLLKLINNILAIARMDTESSVTDEKDFDLYLMLEDLKQSFAPSVQAKRLKFKLEYALSIPRYIHTNERNLRQILMNLLENAIQFTEQGQITLRVSKYIPWQQPATTATPLVYPTSFANLYFEVEDTGPGIAPSDIGHVFKAFMQARMSQHAGQGLGLGLAISQQLIHGMDGEISVESTVGKGTIFRFHIKIDTPIQSQSPTHSPSSPTSLSHQPEIAIAPSPPHSPTLICWTEEKVMETLSAAMPQSWFDELHYAATRGLDQEIVQLIAQIPQDYNHCAECLRNWTEHFLFNKIIELTQRMTTPWES
jgi:PAS domain S-box-containing protein